jgi:hypothetical protein
MTLMQELLACWKWSTIILGNLAAAILIMAKASGFSWVKVDNSAIAQLASELSDVQKADLARLRKQEKMRLEKQIE